MGLTPLESHLLLWGAIGLVLLVGWISHPRRRDVETLSDFWAEHGHQFDAEGEALEGDVA